MANAGKRSWSPSRLLLLLGTVRRRLNLNIDIRAIRFLAPDSPTRQMAEMMDARMGGINIVQLDFDTGKPNGINRLEFLRRMQAVQAFAEDTGTASAAPIRMRR